MSTNNEQILSQKYNNYNYAPGIATYGIDGKIGKTGNDGNNIYFTNYDFVNNNTDLNEIIIKILTNELPIVGLNTKIEHAYKEGDLFFDKNGIIFELYNIDNMSAEASSYTDYFNIVGKLNAKDDYRNIFRFANNRLILNAEKYKGFDILSGINFNNASTYIDKNSAMNIVSNVINENDDIEMVRLQSVDDVDIEDGQLTLSYKTTDNAYYINSNKPVVINADLKVNANNNVDNEYDNFSTVLTSDDTITYFKYLCDKLKYSIIYDDQTNQYILSIYQEDVNRDALDYLVNRKETVFGKIYTGADEQILVKLSDVITGKITSSVYSDYLPAYDIMSLSPTISKSDFNIEYINVDNSSIYIDYVVNAYNKSLSVDVSLDVDLHEHNISDLNNTPIYYKEKLLNEVFGVEASYIKDGNEYELLDNGDIEIDETKQFKTSFIYNKNGQYKFSFNTKNIKRNNGEKFIYLNIIPLINYEGSVPVQITFKIPNNLNGTYTLYFTIQHSNQKFSVLNIMLDNENGVQIFNDNIKYCIQTYLPNNVDSVKKFSLLHNTEIFIDYWNEIPNDENYDNQGEITTYIYKLLAYNSKEYVDTGELVISYDKYYLYSGETTIWNGQVCYIWDRYEDGAQGGTKSEDMPKIDNVDPKDYECKILTNTLDIKMPLTTNSPEYVASLTAYDTDNDYNLAADADSTDYGVPVIQGGLPIKYQGIQILQKIRVNV